jgi:hypothetical protein
VDAEEKGDAREGGGGGAESSGQENERREEGVLDKMEDEGKTTVTAQIREQEVPNNAAASRRKTKGSAFRPGPPPRIGSMVFLTHINCIYQYQDCYSKD